MTWHVCGVLVEGEGSVRAGETVDAKAQKRGCVHIREALRQAGLLGTEEDSQGQRRRRVTSVYVVVGAGLSIQGGEEAGQLPQKDVD